MPRRYVSVALLAIALAATPRPAHARLPGTLSGPFGRGAAEVWLLRPHGPIRNVVVFGHGWKLAPPSPAYPWVGQFQPWLDHLLAGGSAIIFPRYQLGTGDAQDSGRVRDFATGIRTGYRRLGQPKLPFVAVGYSFGATLAFYYAANAGAWRLPRPRAVQAVFPAGTIAGAPLPRLAPSVDVLIQVGDADTEAGHGGADAFWNWLAGHPASQKHYQLVRSTTLLAATHAAPKSATPAARRAFWTPLDRLIAGAQRAKPRPPSTTRARAASRERRPRLPARGTRGPALPPHAPALAEPAVAAP